VHIRACRSDSSLRLGRQSGAIRLRSGSHKHPEGPRLAPATDLPHTHRMVRVGQGRCLTPKGSVVTGSYPSCEGRGLPTALPASSSSVLGRSSRGGFRRYERVVVRDRSRTGQFHLPDKEFRYLRHFCYPVMAGSRDVTRSFLPGSSCRQEGRTVPFLDHTGVVSIECPACSL
jgi:hypothetical protein